jgi:hypothetical protein
MATIELSAPGFYAEVLNTDGAAYGGSNLGNGGGILSEPFPWHGQPHSVVLTLPPPRRPLAPPRDPPMSPWAKRPNRRTRAIHVQACCAT